MTGVPPETFWDLYHVYKAKQVEMRRVVREQDRNYVDEARKRLFKPTQPKKTDENSID